MTSCLCSVDLLCAPYARYTYALPEYLPGSVWHVGQRVLVPLGRRVAMGVIVAWNAPAPGRGVREIICPAEDRPLLDSAYVAMVEDLAIRQLVSPGQVLAAVLPAPLRAVPRIVHKHAGVVPLRELLADPQERLALGHAWVQGEVEVACPGRPPAPFWELAAPPPWPIRPGAVRQRAVLRHLDLHGPCSSHALRRALGAEAVAAVPSLVAKGLVRARVPIEANQDLCLPPDAVVLNAQQQAACQRLAESLGRAEVTTALLYGVTGSGKTAVYLDLVGRVLDAGGCAFLLAPEVALALKLAAEAQRAFPHVPRVVAHGYLRPSHKSQLFLQARQSSGPLLVVGTRSALFLPVTPRLVILDEEHDASFKQDEGLGYQARDVAHLRLRSQGGLLLLGSATPDIKVFHAAQTGRIALVSLSQRVNAQPLPKVALVDMREHRGAVLAPVVRQALDGALAQGEQVIVMHNRRGYAPILVCQSCQEPLVCPQCRISLTWHKARSLVLCHYCGFHADFPLPCPACRSAQFEPLGGGTEQLEEFLRRELPTQVAVARLDRDVGRQPEDAQEILSAFAQGKTQVLVGTQMLCKGHHFPGVSLVVVVDGDLGLNLPDYRAAERSFQMLVQVAGRAGRGEVPGRVFIQTRNPDHPFWGFVVRADFEGLYRHELGLRQAMGYPPFTKLALVRIAIPVQGGDVAGVGRIGDALREEGRRRSVTVLGPAPAPLAVLRGRKRFHCLLKGADWLRLRAVCHAGMEAARREKSLRVSVDFDPMDML